jgi:hypothetical protein
MGHTNNKHKGSIAAYVYEIAALYFEKLSHSDRTKYYVPVAEYMVQ